jgi:SAM-dependent methyltransferase
VSADFPPNTLALDALQFVVAKYRFSTVLDIGAGAGTHAQHLRGTGRAVTTISLSDDYGVPPDRVEDFLNAEFDDTFELVWCSHVLEHQRNAGAFLERAYAVLRPGGILAVTVPPLKDEVVGGHVSLWNGGLLLYNLVLAGFDCRHAAVRTAGYNISVVVRKRLAVLPRLRMDEGDIERLAQFFPLDARQGFDGRIGELNWNAELDDRPVAGSACAVGELDRKLLVDRRVGETDDVEHLRWCCHVTSIAGPALVLGSVGHGEEAVLAEELGGTRLQRVIPGGDGTQTSVRGQTATLVHVGQDVFANAPEALIRLDPLIAPGTVISLGELRDWRSDASTPAADATWQAFVEWVRARGRRVRPLASGAGRAGSFVVAK